MTTLEQATLQERIAELALSHVGEYRERIEPCGTIIRQVLEQAGANYPAANRLRDIGDEILPEERQAGDIVFLYKLKATYEVNTPFHAGILISPLVCVGKTDDRIGVRSYDAMLTESQGYIRVRRIV